jgi:hypothetical protein
MSSPRQRTIRPQCNPAHVALLLTHWFPGFSWRGSCDAYRFRGALQPRPPDGTTYLVEIRYKRGQIPRVFVLEPEINDGAPHLFEDGALCLFHPEVFPWTSDHLVVRCIIPWTTVWLYYYEAWIRLGVWLGPEAPHNLPDDQTSSP